MEFERIGKNTVQCHMTVEEMNEYGLRIEDFFTNQEKSRNFLEQLVERAEEEIGYEVESGMISMQLMRMPDDSLTITFSDKGEDGIHNMINQIQNLAGMIDDNAAATIEDAISEEDEEMHQEEKMQDFEEKTAKQAFEGQQQGKKQKDQQKKIQSAARVYLFEQLDQLEQFAKTIQMQKNISSKLYRDTKQGVWYLLLKKGKLRLEEYQEVCQRLSEYGTVCTMHPFMEQYCKEHFDCVIGKQALRTIREYMS